MLTTIMFWVFAVVAVLAALMVITRSSAIHSALSLVLCFFAVAGLYVMLNAHFIAVAQVIVYAGAIMVLFLFVIMLIGAGASRGEERFTGQAILGWAIGAIMVVQLASLLAGFKLAAPHPGYPFPPDGAKPHAGGKANIMVPDRVLPGRIIQIVLADGDLNADTEASDMAEVTVINGLTHEKETVALREYGADSGLFTGTLNTAFRPNKGKDNDSVIYVSEGHTLTTNYSDGSGSAVAAATVIDKGSGSAELVGITLFTRFVYPVQAIAVLLLMAMIGAVVIAKKRKK
jgi:NADH:ubiquinone oxidoreductase subunit 6 (subunit J)